MEMEIEDDAESSIKFIRLVTGEDIVSNILIMEEDDVDEEHIVLYNPLKIIYLVKPDMNKNSFTQVQIALTPWVMSDIVDIQEFRIEEENILLFATPSDSLIQYYQKYFDHVDSFNGNRSTWEGEIPTVSQSLSEKEEFIILNKLTSK